MGDLLSQQGPLDSAQKEPTVEYTQEELGEFLSKHNPELVNRTTLGWVNTCLRPFKTLGIKGQGHTIQQIMLNK